MKKILLVRMDKIGDLCVTLPADRMFLDSHVVWFVAQGMEFIPQRSLPPRRFLAFSKVWSWKNFKRMVSEVRKLAPDAVVVFQAPSWVSWALFFARVPIRVGVLSKISSFLIFNRGVRQRRSQSDRHELAYNLDLIKQGLNLNSGYTFECIPYLKLVAPEKNTSHFLQKLNFDVPAKSYIVIHPGMAGSALNWSVEKYFELILKIPRSVKIVITGTAMDRPWVDPLQKKLSQVENIIWLNEKLNLEDLMTLLFEAKVVLAPSTGVVHIAAALGTPIVGIYSPRRVETPIRWGPLSNKATVFMPSVSRQNDTDVMNCISTDSVLNALQKYLQD